jgi:hypothetical protein
MVTKPTINLNGTSPEELLDEQLLAIDALRVAISTLWPSPRQTPATTRPGRPARPRRHSSNTGAASTGSKA